jgi:hypothetical protein
LRSRFAPPPMPPVMVWCNVVAVAPVDADRAEALTHHQEGSVARLGAELRQSRAAESPEPYCIGSPAAQNKERYAEAVSPPPCARKPSPAPSPLPSDNRRRSPAALSVGLPHRTVTGGMRELPCAMARPAGRAGAERRQTHKVRQHCFRRWRAVAQSAVRPDRVGCRRPIEAGLRTDQHLGLAERAEDLPAQQFIAQLAVEAPVVAILPRDPTSTTGACDH